MGESDSNIFSSRYSETDTLCVVLHYRHRFDLTPPEHLQVFNAILVLILHMFHKIRYLMCLTLAT